MNVALQSGHYPYRDIYVAPQPGSLMNAEKRAPAEEKSLLCERRKLSGIVWHGCSGVRQAHNQAPMVCCCKMVQYTSAICNVHLFRFIRKAAFCAGNLCLFGGGILAPVAWPVSLFRCCSGLRGTSAARYRMW